MQNPVSQCPELSKFVCATWELERVKVG